MELEFELYIDPEVKESLYQQVKEQSELCDITLQHGQWHKKFHWCVLVQSPFFECLRRCSWRETRTGVVQLSLGSPLILEKTLMYLYGKQPRITENNVEELLEMSDFFLLEYLRHSCVCFLRNLVITEENCIRLIELSQLYGYDDTKLYDFIMAHLPVALQQEQATRLATESVKDILTDPHLSYFTSEEKFIFITKWAYAFEQNANEFSKVFEAIDFGEVDEKFLETVILPHPLVVRMKYQVTPNMITPSKHRVIIFSGQANGEQIVCFDLENEHWRNIDARLSEYICSNEDCTSIAGVCGPVSSKIYRLHSHRSGTFEVFKQDLQSRHTSIYQVTAAPYYIPDKSDMTTHGFNKTLFAAVLQDYIYQRRPPLLTTQETPPKPPPRQKPVLPSHRYRSFKTSTLVIRLFEKQCPDLSPIISIKREQFKSMCINATDTVALLSEQSLYLYDISKCRIEVIPLDACLDIHRMKLVPDEDGFIIYDENQVVTICRSGVKYSVVKYGMPKCEIPLFLNPGHVTYFYSGKIWFRFLQRNSVFEFSSLEHSELIHWNGQDLRWKPLSVESEEFQMAVKSDQAYMIQLPKCILNCHVKCPHCRNLKHVNYISERHQKRCFMTIGNIG